MMPKRAEPPEPDMEWIEIDIRPPFPTVAARPTIDPPDVSEPPPRPRPVISAPVDVPVAIEAPIQQIVSVSAEPPTVTTSAPAGTAPIDVEALAYLDATPPRYPPPEMRKRHQGTVLLRVLVGEDGYPLEVHVVRSSGYAKLDDAARRHVLGVWRFKPAKRDGAPVKAWGKVPVQFRLENL
jgi:protein TonB